MALKYMRNLSAISTWGFGPRDVLIRGEDEEGNALFLDLDIKGARAFLEELTKAVIEAEKTEAAYQRDMAAQEPFDEAEVFNEFSAGVGVNIE